MGQENPNPAEEEEKVEDTEEEADDAFVEFHKDIRDLTIKKGGYITGHIENDEVVIDTHKK